MEFLPCILFSKIPNAPFSIERGHCLHFGIFSLHPKIAQSILGVQGCCKGLFKIWCHIFRNPLSLLSSFLSLLFFSMKRGSFSSFLWAPVQAQPTWAS